MDRLVLRPTPAAAGLDLPQTLGATVLRAVDLGQVTSVMPFRGQLSEVAARLGHAPLLVGQADETIIWMGRNQWFVLGQDGAALAQTLGGIAAVTDQSDGWAAFDLIGPEASAIMMRLTPIDIDRTAFPTGSMARTEVAHMMASVTAIEQGFRLIVMRSFAQTLVHDLTQALRSVHAQSQI